MTVRLLGLLTFVGVLVGMSGCDTRHGSLQGGF